MNFHARKSKCKLANLGRFLRVGTNVQQQLHHASLAIRRRNDEDRLIGLFGRVISRHSDTKRQSTSPTPHAQLGLTPLLINSFTTSVRPSRAATEMGRFFFCAE